MSQPSGQDPYQRSAEAVLEPPQDFWGIVKQIGPGLILTASIVGTGELIATTNLGAQAGMGLLWLVILSCFIKVFVQIELGRFAISTGETTLAGFKRISGFGDGLCWWWFIMMLCTQFQIGAMIGGVGYCIHMAAPGIVTTVAEALASVAPNLSAYLLAKPGVPWAFIITPLTVVLLVHGRYHVVERVSTLLVALFTLLTVICMLLLPWANLNEDRARQTSQIVALAGSPGGYGPLLSAAATAPPPTGIDSIWIAAFAMIGITGVGASELIAYPYWCIEKRYGRYVGPREESDSWARRAIGWIRVMCTDAWLSMIIYTLATIAFFVLGAVVLYDYTGGRGLSGNAATMLRELARMYEPVLGRSLSVWFIAIGGFVVLYSTLFAATAGNSRVTTDFLRVRNMIPFNPEVYRIRFIRFFSGALPILGLLLYLGFENPVAMVVFGGVAQALTLPILAAVAIYLRWRATDRRLIKHGSWDAFLWMSLAMFIIAAAWGIWSQLQKL